MLSENANKVLAARYLLKDDAGNVVETVSEMFSRVARTLADGSRRHLPDTTTEQEKDRAVASIAKLYFDVLYNPEFDSPDFLPNSPTLANAGARTGQLSACFVQKIEDTLSNGKDGIYDTLLKSQLIQQTGGGVGYSMSRLRPMGDRVHTTKGTSTGPMAFADVYNTACGALAQGGMRRGAQMLVLLVTHPDIMQFIAYKADLSKLENFNVSVAITDDFMRAVEAGTDYALINPTTGFEVGRLDAREVFKTIATRAWTTGEPGVVFIDRMNAYNPVRWLGDYEATNPLSLAA